VKRIALLSLITLILCACQSDQRDSSPSLFKEETHRIQLGA
jgi:hypothetical protein